MNTLGIDLSTDPRKTWTCEIDWSASPPVIVSLRCIGERAVEVPGAGPEDWRRPPAVRDEAGLATALAERIVAFDPSPERVAAMAAPFGWPAPFLQAISGWSSGERGTFVKRPEQRLRATDRFVQAVTGLTPMSVSTDRIGSTALLSAEILSRVAQTRGGRLDLATGGDGLIEVSPAAALRMWTNCAGVELPSTGYKATGYTAHHRREQLLELLVGTYDAWDLIGRTPENRERWIAFHGDDDYDGPMSLQHPMLGAAGVATTDDQRHSLEWTDDALDAFIAALAARAAALGHCFTLETPIAAADVEGTPGDRSAATSARRFTRAERARALQAEAATTAAAEGWIHVPQAGTVRDALGLAPSPQIDMDDAWLERATGKRPLPGGGPLATDAPLASPLRAVNF